MGVQSEGTRAEPPGEGLGGGVGGEEGGGQAAPRAGVNSGAEASEEGESVGAAPEVEESELAWLTALKEMSDKRMVMRPICPSSVGASACVRACAWARARTGRGSLT